MFLTVVRFVARIIVRILTRVELVDMDKLPAAGSCIVVTNHLGRLDAMLGIIFTDRNDVVMMVAEKYEKSAIWRFFVRQLDALFVDRYNPDIKALRIVMRRVKAGELLAMAPEGTRSATEQLQPGRPGAAFLAQKTKATLIPVALTGTEDRLVRAAWKRLRRPRIRVKVGEAFDLPARTPGQDREAYLAAATAEIMCQIAAILPPDYRGVYADHPRLHALLAERAAVSGP